MVFVRALAVAVVVVALAACGTSTVPSPATSTAPPSRAPSVFPVESATPVPTPMAIALVTIETRGGECPEGACNRLVNIEADGRIHEVIPKDRILGTVPEPILEALRIEIEQANYPLLQSRPFTGECPTNVDGQETVYTFHVSTGDEELASCKVAIDENHPLFRAVAAAMANAGDGS